MGQHLGPDGLFMENICPIKLRLFYIFVIRSFSCLCVAISFLKVI